METYSFLRELADSWVLLAMTIFFAGTVVWAFRPGSRKVHKDAANIPFRNDDLESPSELSGGTSRADTDRRRATSEKPGAVG